MSHNPLFSIKAFFFLAFIISLSSSPVRAQSFAVSTNIADWASLGTANIETSLSIGQRFSVLIGGRYNPWTFYSKRHETVYQDRKKTGYLGIRYWPWYVYSGWWLTFKGQYEQFFTGGFLRPILEEGTAIGAGLSGGYTIMLHKHFNLEFGIGLWGGYFTDYAKYQCPDCIDPISSGPRGFLRFDDLYWSLCYVF